MPPAAASFSAASGDDKRITRSVAASTSPVVVGMAQPWHPEYDTHAWFGSAAQVVQWFRERREVHFQPVPGRTGERVSLRYDGDEIQPPLTIRLHHGPSTFVDIPWNGTSAVELNLSSVLEPGLPS